MNAALTLLWDTRFSLLTTILAGFGRAAAEVGAVMIVGGNIDGVTRVMTTTIALETSKGDLPLALGLGMILIAIVIAVNAAAYLTKELAQRQIALARFQRNGGGHHPCHPIDVSADDHHRTDFSRGAPESGEDRGQQREARGPEETQRGIHAARPEPPHLRPVFAPGVCDRRARKRS